MVGGKCGSRGGEQTWGGSSFWRFDSVVLSSARGSKRKLECAGAWSIWPIECRKGRAERSRIMGSSWKQTISVTRPCRSNLRSLESCLALPLPTLAGGLPIAPAFQASSVENHGTGFPKPKGLLKPSDLGPRGPRHPRSWRVCQRASLSPAALDYRHAPSWSASRMSLSEKTPRGPLSWAHRPPGRHHAGSHAATGQKPCDLSVPGIWYATFAQEGKVAFSFVSLDDHGSARGYQTCSVPG
jgi:hypothetical protein